MSARAPRTSRASSTQRTAVARIAVGVDGYPEGEDAVALAAALARVTHAEVMLVAVHADPLVVLPPGLDWKSLEKEARVMLAKARDTLAPGARIDVETDLSVARALERVIRREHRDLLVVGSSRQGPDGRTRIGKRTRQLLCHFECPLAIAPRGLRAGADLKLDRIAVGYDDTPESQAALALAQSIALAADGQLYLRGVVDDRIPPVGWSAFAAGGAAMPQWEEAIEAEVKSLTEKAGAAAASFGARGRADVSRGRPADALIELSQNVDLLVIGSRRWGPVARLLLGSTGEALLHDSSCPTLVVPRPHE